MVVRSLEPHKDPFRPKKPDKEILGLEVPYLNAIGALMYLAQCKDQISFLRSICWHIIVLSQLEDIGMILNISFDILKEP